MFHSHLNSNWLAIYTKSLQSKNYRWIRTLGYLLLLLSGLYYKGSIISYDSPYQDSPLRGYMANQLASIYFFFTCDAHAWGSFRIWKHSIIGQRKIWQSFDDIRTWLWTISQLLESHASPNIQKAFWDTIYFLQPQPPPEISHQDFSGDCTGSAEASRRHVDASLDLFVRELHTQER